MQPSLPPEEEPRSGRTMEEVIIDDIMKGAESHGITREQISRFAEGAKYAKTPLWVYFMLERIRDAGERQVQILTRMQDHCCCYRCSHSAARCESGRGEDDLRGPGGDEGCTATRTADLGRTVGDGAPPSYLPAMEELTRV